MSDQEISSACDDQDLELQKAFAIVVAIFDRVLRDTGKTDTVAQEAFKVLCDKTGFNEILTVLTMAKYARAEEVLNMVFEAKNAKTEFVLGCRCPKSEPFSWNDAFIINRFAGQSIITGALFQNGMDFIGYPKSRTDACNAYYKYIKKGWVPMTREDIEKTTGIVSHEDTAVPLIKKKNASLSFGIISILLIACVVGRVFC